MGLFSFSAFTGFEYHVFYLYTHFNFLLLFLPVSKVFSLDAWMAKCKNKITANQQVSALYYYMPIFTGIGLVYFDSFVHKLYSPMWLKGLGFWTPSSLPMIIYQDWSWLLNQYVLSIGLGYGILIFEGVFIFLIWWKQVRYFLLVFGLFLHIGIGLVYPIPYFALLMICAYVLVVPVIFWDKLWKVKSTQASSQTEEKAVFSFSGIRIYRVQLLYFFVIYCCVAQVLWFGFRFFPKESSQREFADTYLKPSYPAIAQLNYFNQFFLGIRKHQLFMDEHFEHYSSIITLVYQNGNQEIWLPLSNQQGLTCGYNKGFIWANWAFRTNGASMNQQALEAGFKRYTAFWALKNGVKLEGSEFRIMLKKVEYPESWERDFLKRQMEQEWVDVGLVSWGGNVCSIEWLVDVLDKL